MEIKLSHKQCAITSLAWDPLDPFGNIRVIVINSLITDEGAIKPWLANKISETSSNI